MTKGIKKTRPYNYFVQQSLFKLFFLIAFCASAFAFFLTYSKLALLSGILTFICALVLKVAFSQYSKREKKQQIIKVFENKLPVNHQVTPILDQAHYYWLKGVAYIDNIAQPIWIGMNEGREGIFLYFLCIARLPPFFLEWHKIKSISIDENAGYKMANVTIFGLSEDIQIPWDDKFEEKYLNCDSEK